MPRLHNCYAFPNVTTNMSTPDLESAESLHFLDEGREVTINSIESALRGCLSTYCKSLDCGYTASEAPLYNADDRFYSIGEITGLQLVQAICASVPTRINSDVGGIGVGGLLHASAYLCSRTGRSTFPIGYKQVSQFWDSLGLSFGNGLYQ